VPASTIVTGPNSPPAKKPPASGRQSVTVCRRV
jgi:hypothetical protein